MVFSVGDKVKIVGGYNGCLNNRIGNVTHISYWGNASSFMVASVKDLPEHYFCEGEFHLIFSEHELEKIEITEGLALFDWANK